MYKRSLKMFEVSFDFFLVLRKYIKFVHKNRLEVESKKSAFECNLYDIIISFE